MELSLFKMLLFKMTTLDLEDFLKKYTLKNDTRSEIVLQRVSNYPIYPRDSKITTDKGFVNIDNSSMGGNRWVVF